MSEGSNIKFLSDNPKHQELINPVFDARMILADWTEIKIKEKSTEAKEYIENWINDTHPDDINIYLGPLGIVGTCYFNKQSLGATLQQLMAIYVLSESFKGNKTNALNGSYYLMKFESILSESKYISEIERRNADDMETSYLNKERGRRSGVTRRHEAERKADLIHTRASQLLDYGIERHKIVSNILRNTSQPGNCVYGEELTSQKIRRALKTHPSWQK